MVNQTGLRNPELVKMMQEAQRCINTEQIDLIQESINPISVKDLQDLNKRQIDFLYGFCVDHIYPEEIFSWSINIVLYDGDNRVLFTEKQIGKNNV